MPDLWSGQTESTEKLPAYGEATYVVDVKRPRDYQDFALMVKAPLSVAKIYINDEELATTGKVGTSKLAEKPQLHIITPSFYSAEDSIRITLQLSNHHNVKGGLNSPILLGTTTQIESLLLRQTIIGSIVGGALLLIGLSHLFFYSLLKEQPANLYFGLFCIMWSSSTFAGDTWGCLISRIFPELPWEATIYLALAPYGLSLPLLVMFYHSLFPKTYARSFEFFYQLLGGIYLCYLAVTPANGFGTGVVLYAFAAMTVFPYLVFNLVVDIIQKRPDAAMLAPGYACLILSDVLEKLIDFKYIQQGLCAAFGAIGFVVFYSVVLTLRFSKTIRSTPATNASDNNGIDFPQEVDTAHPEEVLQIEAIDRRAICVQLMNLILACWHDSTGDSKTDLAHRSGLWAVHMDKNGWERTQTLDKYLEYATIPKNPRYRTVIQTAEYVLLHCENISCRDKIMQTLSKLKSVQ